MSTRKYPFVNTHKYRFVYKHESVLTSLILETLSLQQSCNAQVLLQLISSILKKQTQSLATGKATKHFGNTRTIESSHFQKNLGSLSIGVARGPKGAMPPNF